MKKLRTILGAFLLLIAVTSNAQRREMTPEQLAEAKSKYKITLQDSLQVPEAMADTIANLDFGYQTSMRTLMQNRDLSREDKMAQMKDLKAKKDDAVKALVPADTFEKYLSMQKNRMKGRFGGGQMRRQQNDNE